MLSIHDGQQPEPSVGIARARETLGGSDIVSSSLEESEPLRLYAVLRHKREVSAG